MSNELIEVRGWPCDYCGELDPDWNSVCLKCYEEHKKEILARFLERPNGKRKRKVVRKAVRGE